MMSTSNITNIQAYSSSVSLNIPIIAISSVKCWYKRYIQQIAVAITITTRILKNKSKKHRK